MACHLTLVRTSGQAPVTGRCWRPAASLRHMLTTRCLLLVCDCSLPQLTGMAQWPVVCHQRAPGTICLLAACSGSLLQRWCAVCCRCRPAACTHHQHVLVDTCLSMVGISALLPVAKVCH